MRSKKAALNTTIALIEELVSIICGLILPRLILQTFGSSYNGITTSITQFLRCAVLLRAGIGGATRAALYKPLAKKNKEEIDSIIRATDIFMKKVALILAGIILAFACIYPLFVINEFEWLFSASLVVIIGISTFAESYFGITYQILLQADQRSYVFSVVKIGVAVFNTIIAALLMHHGAPIHVVQLGNATAYALLPIIINLYVTRHYGINKRAKPNMVAISQRWDSFMHQVSAFVMNNTDVMVLTVFADIKEVSVYTVYNLVATALNRAITSVTSGIEAAFGNIIAKNEETSLRRSFDVVETGVCAISSVIYTSALLLILDFVKLYTKGITDIEYIRPLFAVIFITGGFFNCVRLPYQMVVQAAGHYKQTKRGAAIEAGLNIVISVLAVSRFGLVGVAAGTFAATVFRTIQYSMYSSKNILKRSMLNSFVRISTFILAGVLTILVVNLLVKVSVDSFAGFIIKGVLVFMISCITRH